MSGPRPGNAAGDERNALLIAAMPALFVLIWSSGFIVARLGMPHAPPLGFLSWRYALSLLAFALWIAISRPAWPRNPAQWLHLAVTGALMHGGYLGGVWAAVKAGMSAGTTALIVGLQPVLTALWIAYSGQEKRLSALQWAGLVCGFLGVLLVVWRRLGGGDSGGIDAVNLGLTLFALLSITVGTLYQKRHVLPCDVRTANFVQLLSALLLTAPLALLLEHEAIDLAPGFIAAMAWAVLVSTVGGSSLLYMLIARGAASRVTSLFYLTPPCTALMAWALFGEPMTALMLAGLALTALGVWLVVREP
ncbi:MAG: DMT family transporter [Burkholderiales bacterium]